MRKLNLIGGGFQHAHSTTWWKKPKYVKWVKDKSSDISFYLDHTIMSGLNDNDDKVKYAWLNESKAIVNTAFDSVIQNYKEVCEKYEFVFTSYKKMCQLSTNIKWINVNSYWIESPKIYDKMKLVSMITSLKNVCKGHVYRKTWIDKLKGDVDMFGNGFKPVKLKEEGLADYMFSVAMENDSYETYFTEKILDCFATGTIPVYWGAPDIGEHFNMDGIILLDENFSVNQLSAEYYYSKMDAVKDNFERVMNMDLPEDLIYKNYLKK